MRLSLILVRHGHVEGIDIPRFRGRTHLPLTAAGLNQAEKTAEYIRRIAPHLDRIYSSPLTRCITTATIIGRTCELTPQPREGLNDMNYGAWQGRLVSDISRENPAAIATWFRSPLEAVIPQGESLQAMAARVVAVLGEISKENAGKTVVVVSHNSVNRVLLLHALGVSLDSYWRIGQKPGAVSCLEFDGEAWSVESLNETAHLLCGDFDAKGHAAFPSYDARCVRGL